MQDDEQASFDAWASRVQPRLLQAAFLMSGYRHHAQDLVQEALIKIASRWEKLRHEHPDAYARKIVYRDHISWWRRRRETFLDRLPEAAVTDPAGSRVDSLVVGQALARLTVKQRAVLVLRYFEDLTEQQTADTLGVSLGTVKSQTSAALSRLRLVAPELADFRTEGTPHDR